MANKNSGSKDTISGAHEEADSSKGGFLSFLSKSKLSETEFTDWLESRPSVLALRLSVLTSPWNLFRIAEKIPVFPDWLLNKCATEGVWTIFRNPHLTRPSAHRVASLSFQKIFMTGSPWKNSESDKISASMVASAVEEFGYRFSPTQRKRMSALVLGPKGEGRAPRTGDQFADEHYANQRKKAISLLLLDPDCSEEVLMKIWDTGKAEISELDVALFTHPNAGLKTHSHIVGQRFPEGSGRLLVTLLNRAQLFGERKLYWDRIVPYLTTESSIKPLLTWLERAQDAGELGEYVNIEMLRLLLGSTVAKARQRAILSLGSVDKEKLSREEESLLEETSLSISERVDSTLPPDGLLTPAPSTLPPSALKKSSGAKGEKKR